MAKTKYDTDAKAKDAKDSKDKNQDSKDKNQDKPHDGGWRETVESLLMAVILALLFKGYVAEAFVIPTGSMAPTLQGRHRDICCPQCSHWYQASASDEVDNNTGALTYQHVITAACPICRFTHTLDPAQNANEGSFSGDRIIVSKFAYEIAEPKRWDVIVFKWPGGASQNYIKRLVGLPNEQLLITGGNVYVRPHGSAPDSAVIARKPPDKLTAMLQIVDDTDYIPPELTAVGWPPRWRETLAAENAQGAWKAVEGGKSFTCDEVPAGMAWLRYRHLVPTYADWEAVTLQKQLPADVATRRGALITDYYAYNSSVYIEDETSGWAPQGKYYPPPTAFHVPHVDLAEVPARLKNPEGNRLLYDPQLPGPGIPCADMHLGTHWVDDIAVECLADIQDSQGSIALDLVRGGVHYRCTIDVTDGKATLTRTNAAGNSLPFADKDFNEVQNPTASTAVKGAGVYRLRLTNCDHQVMLFVNGRAVQFEKPTFYDSDDIVVPQWNAQDGLDLEPAGVGVSGLRAKVSQLRIYRDKYYLANGGDDYRNAPNADLQTVFANPDLWTSSQVFDRDNRVMAEYRTLANEYFPMGDNSPSSSDGRYWPQHEYLTRDLLIGKALFIYWPHSWNRPVPFLPNLKRMRPIR